MIKTYNQLHIIMHTAKAEGLLPDACLHRMLTYINQTTDNGHNILLWEFELGKPLWETLQWLADENPKDLVPDFFGDNRIDTTIHAMKEIVCEMKQLFVSPFHSTKGDQK